MIGKVDYAFLQVKMAVKYRDIPAEIVTIVYVNFLLLSLPYSYS